MVTRRKSMLGLTMIEMLVVVSVCAVLALLLVPVVFRSRESARRIICQNNLGSIGTALGTMLAGERGYISSAYYEVAPLPENRWWIGSRTVWNTPDPLVRSPLQRSLLCPNAATQYQFMSSNPLGTPTRLTTSYAFNVEMAIIASNISRVAEPVNRVVFYDGDPYQVLGIWDHQLDWPRKTIVRRHLGMANFLYMDGHVESQGDFRAEPFHGCRLARYASTGDAPLPDGRERPGLMGWVMEPAVDLHPESNNVKNNGQDIQCKVVLSPSPQSPVNVNSIYLVGAGGHPFKQGLPALQPVQVTKTSAGDTVCQLKFDRETFYQQLELGGHYGQTIPMKVVGQLADGRPFEALDANNVFNPPVAKK